MKQYMKADVDAGESVVQFSVDIQDYYLQIGNEIHVRTNTRYLMGMSRDNETFTAFFNSLLFHTAPLSLNRLYNAFMNAKIGNSSLGIHVTNWPIRFRDESQHILLTQDNSIGNQLATNTSFAMAFLMAFYVMFYIRERVSQSKRLQFLAGANTIIFWMASIAFDFILHLITALVYCITIGVFREKYWSMSELAVLFIVLVLFGLSSLAFVLVTSFVFKHDSLGFVGLASFFIISGMKFFFSIFYQDFD